MFFNHRHKIVVLLTALAIIFWAITSHAQAQTEEPKDAMTAIMAQIEASGQYHFTAQIEQTLIPRPIPANIGTTEQRFDTQMTGRVVLPDYAQINLLFEANGDDAWFESQWADIETKVDAYRAAKEANND